VRFGAIVLSRSWPGRCATPQPDAPSMSAAFALQQEPGTRPSSLQSTTPNARAAVIQSCHAIRTRMVTTVNPTTPRETGCCQERVFSRTRRRTLPLFLERFPRSVAVLYSHRRLHRFDAIAVCALLPSASQVETH